jgi:16S rRNA G1207 methylase RsmC
MVAGKTQVAAAVAVVALAGSAYAAPAMEPQPLVARMDRIVKAGGKILGHVAKDHAHSTAVDGATDYLKDKFGAKPQPLHPAAAAALAKATGPHDPKLVSAAIGHLPGHKKRELEEALAELLARDFADDEYELVARMDRIVKAAGKAVGHVAKDHLHSTAVDGATDYLKDKFGAKPQPLHPAAAAALAKATGPHDPKLVAAAIGHLPGHKKRELEDGLYARMDKIIKAGGKVLGHVAKDHAHSTAVDGATDYLKDKFGAKQQPLHPSAAAAIAKASGPHDPKIVAAALGHGHKKRAYDDEYELVARMDKIIKAGGKILGHVAKDHAHSTAVDGATDYLKDKFGAKPQPLHPSAAAALAKASGPHDPKLVAAALGHKKRELEDALEELLARAFDDEDYELAARMDRIVKAAGKAVGHVAKDHLHSTAVDGATDYLKDKFGAKPQPLHPAAAAALAKATGPHDPKLVAAAIGHLPGHKKREIEDDLNELFARGIIDDDTYELVARMDKVIKAGGKVLGHVAKDHAHSTLVDQANDKLKDTFGAKPQPLHPSAAAAIAKVSGGHHPSVVNAAIGHIPKSDQKKRRAFEDDLYEIIARGYAYDDLE